MNSRRDDIVEVSIEGLLGSQRNNVVLPLSNPDHMTVLCGINGTGKSTILRIINGVLNSNAEELRHCLFSRASFTTLSGHSLSVERQSVKPDFTTPDVDRVRLTMRGGIDLCFTMSASPSSVPKPWTAHPWQAFEIGSGWRLARARTRSGLMRSRPSGRDEARESLEELEAMTELWRRARRTKDAPDDDDYAPSWLCDFVDAHACTYIPATRESTLSTKPAEHYQSPIFGEQRPNPSDDSPIAERSRQLVALVNEAQQRYSHSAGTQDSEFLDRLLAAMQNKNQPASVSGPGLAGRWGVMQWKQEQLARFGLIDEPPVSGLTGEVLPQGVELRRVLGLYCSATMKKMKSFDAVCLPWQMLLSAVNGQLFDTKSKKLDEKVTSGFRFRKTGPSEGPDSFLDFKDLSSGEQQEIVLQYDQFFGTKPGGLLLVDEPEISLHVDWQRRYLDDLEAAAEARGFYCLVATHSPTILNKHDGSSVELGPRAAGPHKD